MTQSYKKNYRPPEPTPRRIFRTPLAAEYLGLSASSLEKMRCHGGGPKYIRLGGRAIGYDLSDLDAWLEEQRDQTAPHR